MGQKEMFEQHAKKVKKRQAERKAKRAGKANDLIASAMSVATAQDADSHADILTQDLKEAAVVTSQSAHLSEQQVAGRLRRKARRERHLRHEAVNTSNAELQHEFPHLYPALPHNEESATQQHQQHHLRRAKQHLAEKHVNATQQHPQQHLRRAKQHLPEKKTFEKNTHVAHEGTKKSKHANRAK